MSECEWISMFEAMYYPFSSINKEQYLKRYLFYLDKIYVLTADESINSRSRSKLEEINKSSKGLNTILNEVKEYTPRKVIEPINANETFYKYKREIINSINEDLSDYYFRELSNQKEHWMILNDQIPQRVWRAYEDRILKRNGDLVNVDDANEESSLINLVIYTCLDRKISPLTDEIEHSRILNYKINRNYSKWKEFLYEQGYIEDLKQQLLIKKVIEKHLYGLENVNVSDIINYREDHKRELQRFTVEMGKISNQIKSKPFDLEFESEISQIVKDKIDPSIEELNTSMQDFQDEMIKKYVRTVAPLALTFSISAFSAGWEVGVLSSFFVHLIQSKTHISTDLLGTLLDHWQQNRRYERNSLHYLINAEKEFNIT